MRALFLALGGQRKRAVVDESARVVAEGGEAVVVVDTAAAWAGQDFADGVRVIELGPAESRSLALRVERGLLFRLPGAAARRVGRGRLRGPTRRAYAAYERQANRVHRGLMVPGYHTVRGRSRARLIRGSVGGSTAPDLLVVSDLGSMRDAERLMRLYVAGGAGVPGVAFGLQPPPADEETR